MGTLLTVDEASKIIACSHRTLLKAVHNGTIRIADKKGKAFLLPYDDVLAFRAEYRASNRLKFNRDNIVSDYRNGMSGLDIAHKYDASKSGIYGILYSEGVNMRSSSAATRTYDADFRYFQSIDSEGKAYWLGFILADGCVLSGHTRFGLQISLHHRDKNHLSSFKNCMSATHPIHCYGNMCKIVLSSELLIRDLAKHGIGSRKCHRTKLPDTVPIGLLHHFIRGCTDGDGCIRMSLEKQLCYSLAGHKPFLKAVRTILIERCDLNVTKLIKSRHSTSTYQLCYGGNRQVLRILDFLYHDATIYLPRKAKVYFDHCGRPARL